MTREDILARAETGTLFGVFADVPMSDYHGPAFSKYISSTALSMFKKSEAHFHAYRRQKFEATPDMKIGSLIHMAVSEWDLYKNSVVVVPQETRRGTNDWKALAAQNPGKEIIKEGDHELVLKVATKVHDHEEASKLVRGSLVEVTILWRDEETGLSLKCRPDLITPDFGTYSDLKTTKNASPDSFGWDAFNYDYHMKVAMYLEGIAVAAHNPACLSALIAAEKEEPYNVTVFSFEPDPVFEIDPLQHGREEFRKQLTKLAEYLAKEERARQSGEPFKPRGYTTGFTPLYLPRSVSERLSNRKGAVA